MARILYSDELPHGGAIGSHYDESLWVYNALDNCITAEVHEALAPFDGGFAYDMSRMMQAPALTLMLRGLRVDFAARDEAIGETETALQQYNEHLTRLVAESFGMVLNPRSPDQLKILFYKVLKIPEVKQYNKQKREAVVTTNREALEKISSYPRARPLVTLLLATRDLNKRLQFLRTGIDADGRLRSSYNVVGTETGRWSSSENAFFAGTNLQNVTDRLRRLFIPDPGKKFLQFDLKQAESVVVAYLSGDENYIEACRSGDPHTFVCQLCWPDLPWASATSKRERRAIADGKYYRDYSYRELAKKGGHGSNYGGTPHILRMHLKVEQRVAEEFQFKYFRAFPKIKLWHAKVQQQLAATRQLTTAMGRRRFFTGRPSDSSVIKEAIAYEPQSVIGDYLNQGLYRVWKELELPGRVELLAQVHDSILLQFDPLREDENTLINTIQSLMSFPILINGHEVVIHTDAVSGWNWGKASGDNEYGLAEWTGRDDRTAPAQKSPLDRRVHLIHQSFK